jgi:O-acetylserine/cysteine efflux transporter
VSHRDIALALLVAALWGANFVVMKFAVSEFSPLVLTALRFGLAAVPMIFFVAAPAVAWRVVVGFGLAFGIVKFGLLFAAFKLGMPAGLAALVLQMQVLFTVAFAAVALSEHPTRTQWLGLAVSLGGTAIVGASVFGSPTALPLALTLAAAIAWAVANMIVKAARTTDGQPMDMLAFIVWSSLIAPVPMSLLALALDGPVEIARMFTQASAAGFGAVLYLAYPISVLSVTIWSGLLARYSAASLAPFILLVPLLGMASGAAVYGERIGLPILLGGALILAGIAINVRGGPLKPATLQV